MKLAKMLGLAAVAALVAMAFVGVSSASATIPYLCNEAELANCTEETIYKSDPAQEKGDQLIASLQGETEAVLKGKLEVKCQASQVNAGLTQNPAAEQGSQILGQIKELTFTECHKDVVPCTVTVIQLNYVLHLEQAATDGDGVGWVGPQTGDQPGVEILCGLLECTFKAHETQPKGPGVENSLEFSFLGAEGGTEDRVKIIFDQAELRVTKGLPGPCGETATWDAEYEVTKAIVQQGTGEEEVIQDPPGWVTHEP